MVAALFVLALPALTATVKISTCNWHSYNVLAKVYVNELDQRNVVAEERLEQYSSSGDAIAAMRLGDVDIVPESWEPWDPDDSAVFDQRSLGLTGLEGIYVPNYLGVPTDWSSGPSSVDVSKITTLLSPPSSWDPDGSCQAIADKFGFTLVETADAEQFQTQVFERMKKEEAFVFYFWKPHFVTMSYPITEITLPEKDAGGTFFVVTPLLTFWRTDSDAGKVLKKLKWTVSASDMSSMLEKVAGNISLRLPYTSASYGKALALAARDFLCKVTRRYEHCMEISDWPKKKQQDMPEKILMLTKNCAGFAKCVDDDGNPLDFPESGYSIDHAKYIFRELGYTPDEILIRCFDPLGTTNELVREAGKGLADVSHACITILSSRQEVADFSSPFYNLGLRLGILRPRKLEDDVPAQMKALSNPFDGGSWAVILVSFLALGWIVGFAEFYVRAHQNTKLHDHMKAKQPQHEESSLGNLKKKGRYLVRSKTMEEDFRGAMRTSLAIASGDNQIFELKSIFARFLAIFLFGFSVIVISLYTANLAATLTVKTIPKSISGIEDMRGQKAAIICGTSIEEWLKTYEDEVERLCFDTYEEMVGAVLDGTAVAFVYDAPVVEYLESQNCDIMAVGDLFYLQDYGMAFPKDSPLLAPVSTAITHLREMGVNQALYDQHFQLKSCETEAYVEGQMTIWNIVGLILISTAALLVLIGAELLYKHCSSRLGKEKSKKSSAGMPLAGVEALSPVMEKVDVVPQTTEGGNAIGKSTVQVKPASLKGGEPASSSKEMQTETKETQVDSRQTVEVKPAFLEVEELGSPLKEVQDRQHQVLKVLPEAKSLDKRNG